MVLQGLPSTTVIYSGGKEILCPNGTQGVTVFIKASDYSPPKSDQFRSHIQNNL